MKKHIYIYLLWDALQLLRPNSVWDSTRRQTWASNTQGPLPNAFFWLPTALSVFTCPWVSWCQFCLCRCKQSILILIMQCQFFFWETRKLSLRFCPMKSSIFFCHEDLKFDKNMYFLPVSLYSRGFQLADPEVLVRTISFSKLNLHDI